MRIMGSDYHGSEAFCGMLRDIIYDTNGHEIEDNMSDYI